MSLLTHETKWRLLVGAAPVIGVAFFVWAMAQGQADMARSPTARAILAVVAALGTAVTWWTARQLRAAPTLPVARALALARTGQLPGLVALRGRARPLPDAVPLVSPDGELCLWFEHAAPVEEPAGPRDSLRPFLLVDDSGECIVLPAGAQVTGEGSVPVAASGSRLGDESRLPDAPAGERLLRNGDRIHVRGRLVVASAESLRLQAETATRAARAEASQAVVRQGDAPPFRDLRSAAQAGAAYVAAPPLVRHGLPLPVIAAPGASLPLSIRIGADEGEGGLYGMLAVVDCLVLVVSSSLAAWSALVPG